MSVKYKPKKEKIIITVIDKAKKLKTEYA